MYIDKRPLHRAIDFLVNNKPVYDLRCLDLDKTVGDIIDEIIYNYSTLEREFFMNNTGLRETLLNSEDSITLKEFFFQENL